jgi:superfamily II DNA or RNA helicase
VNSGLPSRLGRSGSGRTASPAGPAAGRLRLPPVDEALVRALVGDGTWVRGLLYWREGRAEIVEWLDPSTAVGLVHGGRPQPYTTTVHVTRGPAGRLDDFSGSCSCPVGFHCKHAVALLLVALTSEGGPALPQRRAWEAALARVVEPVARVPAAATVVDGTSELGVQLELTPRARRQRAWGPTDPRVHPDLGLRVRPVVPGRAGWVRSGISWTNLAYHPAVLHQGARGEALRRLFEELSSLNRLGRGGYLYSYREDAVWLDGIPSRRVWDLLAELQQLRVPLLAAGRSAHPVVISAEPAQAEVDVRRHDDGLALAPTLAVAGAPVPLARALPLGQPSHGVAWWEGPDTDPEIHLAPLGAGVDDEVVAFLAGGSLRVPLADEARFLAGFYPSLARRVHAYSGDQSVELPESVDPTLVLDVRSEGAGWLSLRWWIESGAGGPRQLLEEGRAVGTELADGLAERVVATVGSFRPPLTRPGPWGDELETVRDLTGFDAVRFVDEMLPVLADLEGVRVEGAADLPTYREAGERPRLQFEGTAAPQRDWFDLAVSVSVGGEAVPFAQLLTALAQDASHLILPSGTYFRLDVPELAQLAELVTEARALQDAPPGAIRLSRYQASLFQEIESLGPVTAQAGEWMAAVRALAAGRQEDVPLPAGLEAELRPYQHAGFQWLAFLFDHGLGGILADDMGLGKTVQALALIGHAVETGRADQPFLVVAPTSVVPNWHVEAQRFVPGLKVVTLSATAGRRGTELVKMVADADIVVTSYALFRIDFAEYETVAWSGLILDEAQFVKNRASQAYQRARALATGFKLAITGTPMENNLMELWSLLSITAPGLFPQAERFALTYRNPIERAGSPELLDRLRRRIRPLMLRRTKEQVGADLPDKQEQVLELELHSRHRKLYQTYLQRERQKVLGLLGDFRKNRIAIFRSLTLLRQASLDLSLVDPKHANVPSTKLEALDEMLADIVADGHRVLIFSQFTRFLGMARDRARRAGHDLCYLDGRTRNRQAVLDAFRSGEAPLFFISLKAGGFGLNLTEADYSILLDPWWNPATEAQAVDRIHRIGQTRKVMVYRLVAKDTIEEKVMELKARKATLFANVMDDGDFASAALSAADIEALLE